MSTKKINEIKALASHTEGMAGLSTRFAYKVLSKTFNYDTHEVAANPIHLLYVLETQIKKENFDTKVANRYKAILDYEKTEYRKFIEREINKAYIESYTDYGQNLFDRYVKYAHFWRNETDYRSPDTGELLDVEQLEKYLVDVESGTGVSNPADFRQEVINFCLAYQANNGGANPLWTSYSPMREVLEKKIFSNTEELLPIIAFGTKSSKADEVKHNDFVNRMIDNGYTHQQVKLICEWYIRAAKK